MAFFFGFEKMVKSHWESCPSVLSTSEEHFSTTSATYAHHFELSVENVVDKGLACRISIGYTFHR
jgi:hypothetical protein